MKRLIKNLAAFAGIASLGVMLGGCPDQDQPIRIINQTSYPNLPDIVLPSPLDLERVTFDIPRDLSQQIIKNTEECQTVPAAERNGAFWRQCGQYKAIQGSNIYVGVDRENWIKLQNNLRKLQTRDQQFQFRLEQVNRQRKEWRNLNKGNQTAVTINPETPASDVVLVPGI